MAGSSYAVAGAARGATRTANKPHERIVGDRPISTAQAGQQPPYGLAITHRGGVISHLHGSALVAAPGPRLRVLGTEGALVVTALDGQEDRLRAGERPDTVSDWGVEPPAHLPRLVVGERSVPLTGPPGDWPAFYRLLAAALLGDGPPPVDPRDAVAALRVLEAARESAAGGRVVTLS